jgi:hypothetical protein
MCRLLSSGHLQQSYEPWVSELRLYIDKIIHMSRRAFRRHRYWPLLFSKKELHEPRYDNNNAPGSYYEASCVLVLLS